MNLSLEQKPTHRHREQNCDCKGGGWGRDEVGVWGYQMQQIRCYCKAEGTISIHCDKSYWKIICKIIYVCIIESLCHSGESSTTL